MGSISKRDPEARRMALLDILRTLVTGEPREGRKTLSESRGTVPEGGTVPVPAGVPGRLPAYDYADSFIRFVGWKPISWMSTATVGLFIRPGDVMPLLSKLGVFESELNRMGPVSPSLLLVGSPLVPRCCGPFIVHGWSLGLFVTFVWMQSVELAKLFLVAVEALLVVALPNTGPIAYTTVPDSAQVSLLVEVLLTVWHGRGVFGRRDDSDRSGVGRVDDWGCILTHNMSEFRQ